MLGLIAFSGPVLGDAARSLPMCSGCHGADGVSGVPPDAPIIAGIPAVVQEDALYAYQDGAYECWPRHSKKPKIGKVYVTYGKSFSPQEIKELGADEFAKVLTARLRKMQNEMRIKHGKEQYEY